MTQTSSGRRTTTCVSPCFRLVAPDLLRDRAAGAPIWQLPLAEIRLDGGTQARVAMATLVVDAYAAAMHAGTVFPPIVVFRDGTSYWLADGFHRVYAAQHAGLTTLAAEIHPGTQRDAVLYAVGANATHGLRRTNADKRRAVTMLLTDSDWSDWSNREIARRCGVNESLVRSMRKGLTAVEPQSTRVYRDRYGNVATMKTTGIGQRNTPPFDAAASLSPAQRAVLDGSTLADNAQELAALARVIDPATQDAILTKLLAGEAQTVREAVRQLTYADKQAVTLQEVVQGQFPVVYADPPWQYTNARLNGAAAAHYPTMHTDALCALPVADYTTSNAVLFLWTTNPLLQDALRVMTAWGFTYRTNLVWVKDRATYGKLGFYTHGRHELLLIGVRGSCLPNTGYLPDSVLTTQKGRHSAKPEDVYTLIERMYDAPYLELFARQTRPGWTSFGNDVRERPAHYGTSVETTALTACRILLVEDEPDLRELLSLVFTIAGCQLTGAGSVAEALTLLAHETFDVLLTDYQLPDGTGDTVIRRIQAAAWPIATVLMSAVPHVAELAADCRADGHFAKGHELSRLVALVLALVEGG